MTALGFGTDYMEKYVPFTINLSDIAFKDLVDQALSEETQLNGDLCKNDFSFFSCPLHLDYFLSNALGLNFTLSIQLNRITPRKVKSFIKEINLTLANENLVPEDNKRTIIAFYYLKIFMWELYEKLPFFKDFQDEINQKIAQKLYEEFEKGNSNINGIIDNLDQDQQNQITMIMAEDYEIQLALRKFIIFFPQRKMKRKMSMSSGIETNLHY